MSSEEAALLRLLARSSRAELRGLRREGVLTEGVAGMEESESMSDLQCLALSNLRTCCRKGVVRLPVLSDGMTICGVERGGAVPVDAGPRHCSQWICSMPRTRLMLQLFSRQP